MAEGVHVRIERARWYAQQVRSGHVNTTDAAAVVATLSRYLADVIEVIDDQWIATPAPEGEQRYLRDELLAEVPASERAPGGPDIDCATAVATTLARLPGDTVTVVTRWLQAARAEASLAPAGPEGREL